MEFEILVRLLFAASLGGILGSFGNVLIIRWHGGKSLGGRSRCPGCKRPIKPRHLIPVVSWLWLRGRCAYCGRKIHPQYVLVEAAALSLGILAAIRWDPFSGPQFWLEFLLTTGLLVPIVMDLRWQELPVEFMLGLGVFGAVFGLLGFSPWMPGGWLAVKAILLGCCVMAIFFGSQIILSRGRWLGEGDFWFVLMMGLALGWPTVAVAAYAAYVFGGLLAVAWYLAGRLNLKSKLPFAPALAAGTMVAMWYGPSLTRYFAYAFK